MSATSNLKRVAVYARVSTLHQKPENQVGEWRGYVTARGSTATEFVDRGVSGARERRPALDAMLADAKRRRFDVVIVWRLDRLAICAILSVSSTNWPLSASSSSRWTRGSTSTRQPDAYNCIFSRRSPSSSGRGSLSASGRVWRVFERREGLSVVRARRRCLTAFLQA